MSKFYITNAIPYVNAKPHIGHALEFVQSDVIARYRKIQGDNVLLLSGGDENALKNVQAAEKAGVPIQEFVDKNTELFHNLSKHLSVSFDVWQKGSDKKNHYAATQKLWELCNKAGDIYKKAYKGLYCVGCEMFYSEDELDENRECFEHPGKRLDEVEEENYFFRLSKYQNQLIDLLSSGKYQIVPEFRKNEMLSFLKNPLEDISISRSNERAKNWGVPVPNDASQRIYVWFDGLNIYQSGIGFGWNQAEYKKWWPADIHVIGKGIARFHAIYWPAFLLSANLALPKKLFIHEYFTVNGKKMSKTIGNVIDPEILIQKYGTDALRYYFLAKFSPFSDGDFSEEKLQSIYTSDLSNGLGNLVSRIAKLCENASFDITDHSKHSIDNDTYTKAIEEFKFNEALSIVWNKIADTDKYINKEQPWSLIKSNPNRSKEVLAHLVDQIEEIAVLLSPFLPNTSEKILSIFHEKVKLDKPLFPRIS